MTNGIFNKKKHNSVIMNLTLNKFILLYSLLFLFLIYGFADAAPSQSKEEGISYKNSLQAGPAIHPTKNPKMDGYLSRLIDLNKQGLYGKTQVSEEESLGIQVIIVTDEDQNPDGLTLLLEKEGVETQGWYKNLCQATVPISSLEAVSQISGVLYIRIPNDPISCDIPTISEGVGLTGAFCFHNAGFRGAGVKIAVVDVGFIGYYDILGTDLPQSVITRSFVNDENGNGAFPGGSDHGRKCAEIVYDMAPEAELYLVRFRTIVELGNAVDWLIGEGINVISFSVGWANLGPYDGTGPVCDIVENAYNNGILWMNAAGNQAKMHYEGYFNPLLQTSANPYSMESLYMHDFENPHPADGGNSVDNLVYVVKDKKIQLYLSWNDWTSCDLDLKLRLLKWTAGSYMEVAESDNTQDGTVGQTPTEYLEYTNTTGSGWYVIRIESNETSIPPDCYIELYSENHNFNYSISSGSIIIPSDSPYALCVGAIAKYFWYDGILEYYSSQGPINGPGGEAPLPGANVKPDICGPTSVSISGSKSFSGTSAATPHIAGAAALLLSRYPQLTIDECASLLEKWAIDLGDPGKDTLFGSGRLALHCYLVNDDEDYVLPGGGAAPNWPGILGYFDARFSDTLTAGGDEIYPGWCADLDTKIYLDFWYHDVKCYSSLTASDDCALVGNPANLPLVNFLLYCYRNNGNPIFIQASNSDIQAVIWKLLFNGFPWGAGHIKGGGVTWDPNLVDEIFQYVDANNGTMPDYESNNDLPIVIVIDCGDQVNLLEIPYWLYLNLLDLGIVNDCQ